MDGYDISTARIVGKNTGSAKRGVKATAKAGKVNTKGTEQVKPNCRVELLITDNRAKSQDNCELLSGSYVTNALATIMLDGKPLFTPREIARFEKEYAVEYRKQLKKRYNSRRVPTGCKIDITAALTRAGLGAKYNKFIAAKRGEAASDSAASAQQRPAFPAMAPTKAEELTTAQPAPAPQPSQETQPKVVEQQQPTETAASQTPSTDTTPQNVPTEPELTELVLDEEEKKSNGKIIFRTGAKSSRQDFDEEITGKDLASALRSVRTNGHGAFSTNAIKHIIKYVKEHPECKNEDGSINLTDAIISAIKARGGHRDALKRYNELIMDDDAKAAFAATTPFGSLTTSIGLMADEDIQIDEIEMPEIDTQHNLVFNITPETTALEMPTMLTAQEQEERRLTALHQDSLEAAAQEEREMTEWALARAKEAEEAQRAQELALKQQEEAAALARAQAVDTTLPDGIAFIEKAELSAEDLKDDDKVARQIAIWIKDNPNATYEETLAMATTGDTPLLTHYQSDAAAVIARGKNYAQYFIPAQTQAQNLIAQIETMKAENKPHEEIVAATDTLRDMYGKINTTQQYIDTFSPTKEQEIALRSERIKESHLGIDVSIALENNPELSDEELIAKIPEGKIPKGYTKDDISTLIARARAKNGWFTPFEEQNAALRATVENPAFLQQNTAQNVAVNAPQEQPKAAAEVPIAEVPQEAPAAIPTEAIAAAPTETPVAAPAAEAPQEESPVAAVDTPQTTTTPIELGDITPPEGLVFLKETQLSGDDLKDEEKVAQQFAFLAAANPTLPFEKIYEMATTGATPILDTNIHKTNAHSIASRGMAYAEYYLTAQTKANELKNNIEQYQNGQNPNTDIAADAEQLRGMYERMQTAQAYIDILHPIGKAREVAQSDKIKEANLDLFIKTYLRSTETPTFEEFLAGLNPNNIPTSYTEADLQALFDGIKNHTKIDSPVQRQRIALREKLDASTPIDRTQTTAIAADTKPEPEIPAAPTANAPDIIPTVGTPEFATLSAGITEPQTLAMGAPIQSEPPMMLAMGMPAPDEPVPPPDAEPAPPVTVTEEPSNNDTPATAPATEETVVTEEPTPQVTAETPQTNNIEESAPASNDVDRMKNLTDDEINALYKKLADALQNNADDSTINQILDELKEISKHRASIAPTLQRTNTPELDFRNYSSFYNANGINNLYSGLATSIATGDVDAIKTCIDCLRTAVSAGYPIDLDNSSIDTSKIKLKRVYLNNDTTSYKGDARYIGFRKDPNNKSIEEWLNRDRIPNTGKAGIIIGCFDAKDNKRFYFFSGEDARTRLMSVIYSIKTKEDLDAINKTLQDNWGPSNPNNIEYIANQLDDARKEEIYRHLAQYDPYYKQQYDKLFPNHD